jgi:hypothetical protein
MSLFDLTIAIPRPAVLGGVGRVPGGGDGAVQPDGKE